MSSDQTQHQSDDEQRLARELSLEPMRPPADVPGYELLNFLGSGAYGEVWSALDQKTGRSVAIKFYTRRTTEDIRLLAREVEKLVVLAADRYVVQLLDVGWDFDPPYFVMDYIEHGSLEDRLANKRVMTPTDSTELFSEIARGMMHLHGKGILHCDLKPGNVLLDEDGKPRLADFGQARLKSDSSSSLGTLFYMAPEQADTKAVPDARWDVYSLGALFYSMLTGAPPYFDRDLAEKIQSTEGIQIRLEQYKEALAEAPKPTAHRQIKGIDRALADIIDRCIAVQSKERFGSVQAVLMALRQREIVKARKPVMWLGLFGPLLLLAIMSFFGWSAYQRANSGFKTAVIEKAVESNRFAAQLAARSATAQIAEYFRAVRGMAIDDDLREDFELLVADVQFADLRKQLSDPNRNSDRALDPIRQEYIDHEIRQKLQNHLIRRLEDKNNEYPSVASWLVYDREGNQLAAIFDADKKSTENTIGKNYSYRTYFTGLNRDLATKNSADSSVTYHVGQGASDRTIISHPHMSAIFFSEATANWKVAFSAPLLVDDVVVGLVGCTVEMGGFIEFENGKSQYAMLIDGRPGDNTGVILEHPLFNDLKMQGKRVPKSLTELRVPVSELGRSVLFTDPLSKDPLGEHDFSGQWLAAVQFVQGQEFLAQNADAESKDNTSGSVNAENTGLIVLAAENYESVIEPVNELGARLTWLGGGAFFFFLIVTVGMWTLVRRMFEESGDRLGVAFSRSGDSSLSPDLKTIPVSGTGTDFKTVPKENN